jgi:hypothetical protein
VRAKRLPRLWCALQGVLPLEPTRAGTPQAPVAGRPMAPRAEPVTDRNRIAVGRAAGNVRSDGAV